MRIVCFVVYFCLSQKLPVWGVLLAEWLRRIPHNRNVPGLIPVVTYYTPPPPFPLVSCLPLCCLLLSNKGKNAKPKIPRRTKNQALSLNTGFGPKCAEHSFSYSSYTLSPIALCVMIFSRANFHKISVTQKKTADRCTRMKNNCTCFKKT